MSREQTLMQYYQAMLGHLGPSHWWPGDTPFEVAVGAVLTQNTSWTNVDKALALLKQAGPLTPLQVWNMPVEELQECLRPSGYYTVKAQRLRSLLEFFAQAAGQPEPPADSNLTFLQQYDTQFLREGLLGVRGVGPETADAILLYALGRESFVVDAYTQRMLHRHGLVEEDASYEELREFFMDVLPADAQLFNEYHALIVRVGKDFCKKSAPRCNQCPLRPFLEYEPE